MEVKCFVEIEKLEAYGKLFLAEEEVVERHLFLKENPYAWTVPHIQGWLKPGDVFIGSCNPWGEGISRKDDRPLIRDEQGRISVRIKTTTTGVDVYIEGLPPGASFCVNGPELTAEQASELAGQPIRLSQLTIGDMYQNGVGRWADHR